MANSNQERNDNFKCTIISSCAKLGVAKENGNCKELNYISYGNADPKWDIREWNPDHTKMSRGITLNDAELLDLYAAIGEAMRHDKPSIKGPGRPKAISNPWNESGAVVTAAEPETQAQADTEANADVDEEFEEAFESETEAEAEALAC